MKGVKSKELSKQYKIDIKQVYRLSESFKEFLKSTFLKEEGEVPLKRRPIMENENLLRLLHHYFLLNGIHNITLKVLQDYIKNNLPNDLQRAPSTSYIREILKKHFYLQYKKFKTANYKYRDPTYNEKRSWVCRILTQFLHDGALIISIDETGFRSDTVKDMKWQFNSYMKKQKVDLSNGCNQV